MSPTTGDSASSDADDVGDDASDALDPEDERILEVTREHHRASLLDFLDAVAGPIDRRALQQASKDGHLLLNGEPVGPGVTLRQGDEVRVEVPIDTLERRPSARIVILHQAGGLVVASKPSGMPFDTGRKGGANALAALRDACDGDARPRPLHRLDKPTSGVVVAALDGATEESILAAFREGRAAVEYLAVVRGRFPDDEGRIDIPLGKRRKSDAILVPDPSHGTPCATAFTVEERLPGFAVLRVQPEGSGRSHQVRAHLAAHGHPVLCDADYGEDAQLLVSQIKIGYRRKRGRPERPVLARPALHARAFVLDGQRIEAPLPDDLTVLLAQLRRLDGSTRDPFRPDLEDDAED